MWFTITTCTQPWWAVQGVCFQFGASFSNQTNVNYLANLLLLHEADRNLTKFQPSPLPPSNQIDSPKFCRVFALEKTFLLPLLGKLILGSCIILLATNFEIFTENEICFQLILKIQFSKHTRAQRDFHPFGIDGCTWKVTPVKYCWKAEGETIWEIPRIIRPLPSFKLFLNNFPTIPQELQIGSVWILFSSNICFLFF